jgi:hypothetical protein
VLGDRHPEPGVVGRNFPVADARRKDLASYPERARWSMKVERNLSKSGSAVTGV